MSRSKFIVCVYTLLLGGATISPLPVRADWPTDPTVNVLMCNAPLAQRNVQGVSDGAGGAIYVWTDLRESTPLTQDDTNVYAHHVLATGVPDPAWPANGLAVCTAPGNQNVMQANASVTVILPDGSGGALVMWFDVRGEGFRGTYVHHVLSSGIVDPQWPIGGVHCGDESSRSIAPDGSGGVLVVTDRGGLVGMLVHHVLATGSLDPAWPITGLALESEPPGSGHLATLTSDGAAGAIVAWRQANNNSTIANHVLANGSIDPAWPSTGVVLSNVAQQQQQVQPGPRLVGDGAGGAIVVWQDYRDATATGSNLFAQHVSADGTVDPAWPLNGSPVCTAPGHQTLPRLVSDGSGGAIITWTDQRNIQAQVYVQRVRSNGARDPDWPVNGLKMTTENFFQSQPTIASDGAGGAFLAWVGTGGETGIYAQHVQADASVDRMRWPTIVGCEVAVDYTGTSISYGLPMIVADGLGGAIVGWHDARSGQAGADEDIYVQRVQCGYSTSNTLELSCTGQPLTCTEILTPIDGSNSPHIGTTEGGYCIVRVEESCGGTCDIECLISPTGQPGGAVWPPISGTILAGNMLRIGPFTQTGLYTYDMFCSPGVSGQIDVTSPAVGVSDEGPIRTFDLLPIRPNPTRGSAQIVFSLPRDERVQVQVHDVLGRVVATLADRVYFAGEHRIAWDGMKSGRLVPAGIYFVRCTYAGKFMSRPVTILR